jgi:hypothetical protein
METGRLPQGCHDSFERHNDVVEELSRLLQTHTLECHVTFKNDMSRTVD